MSDRAIQWKRDRSTPHVVSITFPNGASAKVFGRERGLLGPHPFVVRFYDSFGRITDDRHEFDRQAAAKRFAVSCYTEGKI